MKLRAAGHTEKGSVRSSNEDCFAVDETTQFCVVADGMGGHNAGEVASRLAVTSLLGTIRGYATTLAAGHEGDLRSVTWPYGIDPRLSDAGNCLRTAIHLANAQIVEASLSNAEYAGMGTTVVAAFVNRGRLSIAHAGDSRCYLLSAGGLQLLTRDDSWAVALASEGTVDPATAQNHPMRSALTNVVGTRSRVEVHMKEVELEGNERFLLSTDGVHSVLDEEWIARLLMRTEDVTEAAVGLVDAALSRGSRDNCTAVVARLTAVD